MAKRFVIFCVLFALISSHFSQFFTYTGFEVNQKYIAENLCVNKSKPWMHCNGRCYLMKKLKQAEEKEKSQEKQSQRNLFQNINVINLTSLKFHNSLLQIISTPYQPLKPIVFTGSIFHPPKLA